MTDSGAAGAPTHHPTLPGPPAPPPGPGVVPPFAAPPVEGRTMRLWLGIGVAGLVALMCCGAGAAALVGLAVASSQAIDEQAGTVTNAYYAALRDRDYQAAYDLLCDPIQRRETPQQFRARVTAQPDITSYRVGEVQVSNEVTVPVEVTYSGGGRDNQQVTLRQDTSTGQFEVCGIR